MGLLALALGNPIVAIGGIAAVGLAVTAAYYKVHHDGFVEGKEEIQAKWDSEEEGRRMANRAASEKLSRDVQITRNKNAQALVNVQSKLDAANRELLSRPDRPGATDTTRSGCTGASGAELSRPDAAFLTGYAASAAAIQSSLAACWDELDAAHKIMNGEVAP